MACHATIVITTKNRCNELRSALQSAVRLRGDIEVLVIDDGSTDDTSKMVQREFPGVRLVRYEESAGLVVRRNQAAEFASGTIIVSIDDDAIFPSSATVVQTLDDFDHPRIAAVAIPFVNVRQDEVVRQFVSGQTEPLVTHSYIGTAHAIRRDVFLSIGGYRQQLVHQGEERDLCLRLMACGFVTRIGRADPIHHLESPRRDFRRMDLYGRRNDVLFAWHNVPLAQLPLHLAGTVCKGLLFGMRVRRPVRMAHGLVCGFAAIPGQWAERQPVDYSIYKLAAELRRHGSMPLSAMIDRLPALSQTILNPLELNTVSS